MKILEWTIMSALTLVGNSVLTMLCGQRIAEKNSAKIENFNLTLKDILEEVNIYKGVFELSKNNTGVKYKTNCDPLR